MQAVANLENIRCSFCGLECSTQTIKIWGGFTYIEVHCGSECKKILKEALRDPAEISKGMVYKVTTDTATGHYSFKEDLTDAYHGSTNIELNNGGLVEKLKNKNMTLEEIKNLKSVLEKDITKLISRFNDEAGITVRRIDLLPYRNYANDKYNYNITDIKAVLEEI